MNKNTKIIRIFPKQLKSKQRKYTSLTNYLNVLEIFKKTWNIIKGIIGKLKLKSTNFPQTLTINKVDAFNKPKITNAFKDFLTNNGQKLASQIPKWLKRFETYINKVNVILDSKSLSINQLQEAFFSLKLNESSDVDDVSFDIIKKCFGVLCEPLIYLFQLSLEKGVFSNDLKLTKVTLVYKTGASSGISSYRPILVLPIFSKILERFMYNRLYKFLKESNILYEKQFGF